MPHYKVSTTQHPFGECGMLKTYCARDVEAMSNAAGQTDLILPKQNFYFATEMKELKAESRRVECEGRPGTLIFVSLSLVGRGRVCSGAGLYRAC